MSFRAAVVTVSDRSAAGAREDLAGPLLVEALIGAGGDVVSRTIVPDERPAIEGELRRLVDMERVTLVITTGGTGFAPRDVTPEATRAVIEREAPGLAEHARAATLAKTRFAILSRGIAGIRRHSLIVNLPGNPQGARDMLDALLPVLPHALSVLAKGGDEHPVS
jgi:molybdenum cofactor synthesis domain-containing protein